MVNKPDRYEAINSLHITILNQPAAEIIRKRSYVLKTLRSLWREKAIQSIIGRSS